jgi:hypothetical protein
MDLEPTLGFTPILGVRTFLPGGVLEESGI